jgi:hypothetical protein
MLIQTVSAMAVLNGILVSILGEDDMTIADEIALGRRRLLAAGGDALARCGTDQCSVGAACLGP